MKTPLSLRRVRAGLCGVIALLLLASLPLAAQASATGPQQLLFTGLLGSSNPDPTNAHYAQFNAIKSDSAGNLYLLLDQGDGIRLLKTDPTATNVLAQTHLGSSGDIGLAMALDPSGNLYLTGTTTSGTLSTTSGAAFPSAAPNPGDTSINSYIGKFDQNLNTVFLTYAGSPRTAASAIAATADAVFLTGSIFGSALPVTPSGIIQSPASGSLQNGFVEKFNTTGTTLLYATYLSGQNGNTAPAAIAADAGDNAYIAGYTTSTGYPTLAAIIPDLLTPTSGFLTKLTPAGDGIVFSTFIPGPGISSLVIDPSPQDPTTQNLLLTGSIAPGQFPIATVSSPLVNTNYQTLLRLSLDGSTLLTSDLLAPGTQSSVALAPSGAAWVTGTLTGELTANPAWLLPLTPLSTIGNSYALRLTQQNTIDQTIRFGGLPITTGAFASAPVTLTGLTVDSTGQPTFAGSASPTASASLLSTETYDLPLVNTPTPALPSTLRSAALPASSCTNGSLCSGSAAYLAQLSTTAAPSLALSTDDSPNLTLRNLGSADATNLQLSATGFTLATNCPPTLPPGGECGIALTGPGPGTLTAQAANASSQTANLPATTATPNPIVFSPKELDFGIQTASSPATTRTVTISNLSQQTQTFASYTDVFNPVPPQYTFTQQSTDCSPATSPNSYTLPPSGSCHLTIALTAPTTATGSFVNAYSTIASRNILLTAYTQPTDLNLSAPEIDFGTQFGTPSGVGGSPSPTLPRYLYLSNNSANAVTHIPVTLAAPFTLNDRCPTTLNPHTVCQLQINYQSQVAPSADSTTLTLDEGLVVLITGTTKPQPTSVGQSANPNLTLTPATITFPNAVPVTTTSSTTQTVIIGNTGPVAFYLALTLTGDFTDATDCPFTLAGNATCTVVLTFAPSQPGIRQGLLSVTAGGGSPAYVTLSGTGSAILTAPNNTLFFGSVPVGQPAVQWYKITSPFTTLTATTSAPDFKAILVEDIGFGHGQPSTSAFVSSFTGTCANCWLGVQFTPSAPGSQTAAITLASSGNPSAITLTGTGTALSGILLSPTTQDFGTVPVNSASAPTLFTVTNLTAAPVTLTAPTPTGDFALSNAPTGGSPCSGPLAPNASCFFNVVFAPTATGSRTGTLTVPASSGPITANLTGFASPDPGLALNPTALLFNNVPGPTATQQNILLTNTAAATLQIGTPTNATPSFTSTNNCTTLAPTAACTIAVTFLPTTATVTDTLQIPVTSSTTGLATYTVPLSGAYTTESAGLQILPNQANYAATPTSTLGGTRQFTITNLTAKSLALNIALPRQFLLNGPACAALAPNASCNFNVTFLPLTNGDITGTLFAQGTPTDGSATLNGLGYVEGFGIGPATLKITGNIIPGQTVLDFGQVPSGQTAAQTVTLTNIGAIPLTIRRLTSQWPFLITSTLCGATLPPTVSCTATLTYTPLNQTTTPGPATPDSGTLIIESDALTGPDLLTLTGRAAPITVAAPSNTAPLVSYALSQSSLTFLATQVGDQSDVQSVTLANTGTTTIHIAGFRPMPDFTVQSNCIGTLVPSASCVINISFTPQASFPNTVSNRISALEITSDSSTALEFLSIFGVANPSPLNFSPFTLNFGSVQIGTSATLPVQITNITTAPIAIQTISAVGPYTATGDCPTEGNTLAPSTSCTEQVTFTPTTPATIGGLLSIRSSASTLPIEYPLTGKGIQSRLQAVPSTLSFSSIALGASAAQTITLTNTGTAPITNLALTITGDYAISIPCATSTLTPGNSCQITVTFAPTTLGSRTGTITSTDPNTGLQNLNIPLTGTGVSSGAFTLTVNGGPSATLTIPSEHAADYTLQLTPQSGFAGTVIFNCTPVNPGAWATCSLLPSSITLNGAAQNSIATLNTVAEYIPQTTATNTRSRTLLCLLPLSALLFWRSKNRTLQKHPLRLLLFAIILTLPTLWISGCGRGDTDPNLRFTPPGTYLYQVTASSTTGVQLSQTVTLNLIVTAH
ncbi:choice-of-anchor D domain-containing protein [Tunturibacter empetritectus]|uniref:Choice-of-anchor D domain-containing protein n=1 Tax=Tunturiibacter empetritectus TaxID=3069691 RepID=A0AAU7ZBH4_9BACT